MGVSNLGLGILLWKWSSWESVSKVAWIFVILGYESILCFEFKFINFKILNPFIYLIN